jgi:hypothetical protein
MQQSSQQKKRHPSKDVNCLLFAHKLKDHYTIANCKHNARGDALECSLALHRKRRMQWQAHTGSTRCGTRVLTCTPSQAHDAVASTHTMHAVRHSSAHSPSCLITTDAIIVRSFDSSSSSCANLSLVSWPSAGLPSAAAIAARDGLQCDAPTGHLPPA